MSSHILLTFRFNIKEIGTFTQSGGYASANYYSGSLKNMVSLVSELRIILMDLTFTDKKCKLHQWDSYQIMGERQLWDVDDGNVNK